MIKLVIVLTIILMVMNFPIHAQTIQSSCELVDSTNISEIQRFAKQIAISEMKKESNIFHDSILVPKSYIESISQYITALDNAIQLSDSIMDYKNFIFFKSEFGFLNIKIKSFCIDSLDNSISNHHLANYVDSLGINYNSKNMELTSTEKAINIHGNFDFLLSTQCIERIDIHYAFADIGYCYKHRDAWFENSNLRIYLIDDNYMAICEGESYYKIGEYFITEDCNIEILNYETNVKAYSINSLIIYPNPTKGSIQFQSEKAENEITIFDVNGIKQFDIVTSESNIDISGLPDGVYLVQFNNQKPIKVLKNSD